VESLVASKIENVTKMKQLLPIYQDVLMREEEMKVAIAIKTGTADQEADDDLNSSMNEAGGVIMTESKGFSDQFTPTTSEKQHAANDSALKTSLADDLSETDSVLSVLITDDKEDDSDEESGSDDDQENASDSETFQLEPPKQSNVSHPADVPKLGETRMQRSLLSVSPTNSSSQLSKSPGQPSEAIAISRPRLDSNATSSSSPSSGSFIDSSFSLSSSMRSRKGHPPPRVIVGHNKTFDVERINSPILGTSPRSSRLSSFFQSYSGLSSNGSNGSSGPPSSNPMMASAGLSPGPPPSQSVSASAVSSPLLPPTIPSQSYSSSLLPGRSIPSIKDYEIIKPISKGAYGSVYLAKKRLTGEYYAIKVLRKSDMVAKNQVMNIKAERMILMQLDSPYVVKLYFSFQSKENLYLVMEYLNGGDCAALIKAIGQLDEKWAKQYICEVVLGLEFLHGRGIVHR
jgi:hypothetical protein